MLLPDLCLLLHEAGDLAPDELLCAPAVEQLRSGRILWSRGFLVRSVTLDTGKSELVARHNQPDAPLLWFRFPQSSRMLADAITEGYFERRLFFGADGRLVCAGQQWHRCLQIDRIGKAEWIGRDGARASFRWKADVLVDHKLSRSWRTHTSDRDVEKDVRAMLRDDRSDCAFSWRWSGADEREKTNLMFVADAGDLENCQRLLGSIVWSDRDLSQHSAWDWQVELSQIDSHPATEGGLLLLGSSLIENASDSYDLSARQRRLLELVVTHCKLRYRYENSQRSALRDIWKFDGYQWRFSMPIPSAHQQLEARLQLRAWLRDKVPIDELGELTGGA